jgi:hypothetical protein
MGGGYEAPERHGAQTAVGGGEAWSQGADLTYVPPRGTASATTPCVTTASSRRMKTNAMRWPRSLGHPR